MRVIDGRAVWFMARPVPTLLVCEQCGAHWEPGDPDRWRNRTIKHVGPHGPNERQYKRVNGWPCVHTWGDGWVDARGEGVCLVEVCITCGTERRCLSG
jgi:hypothetical protein